ncbi:hypothetical protein [Streptomyces sp. NPDC127197]|uniref:hypothetical protein n=1 Tax=Streptomyces sp. NPDC127197 TaxID=3345388 RepID=UPI0036372456
MLEDGVDLSQVGSEDELGPEVLSEYGYIERYADYQTWNDPDTCLTSVWHVSGDWTGSTDDPSTLSDLIAAHQRRTMLAPPAATHGARPRPSAPAQQATTDALAPHAELAPQDLAEQRGAHPHRLTSAPKNGPGRPLATEPGRPGCHPAA